MNRLQPLLFPETSTDSTIAQELLLVCDSLLSYQFPPVTETDPTSQGLKEKELYSAYNPIVFTEEEENSFTRLVKDLKGNEEEFYGGYLASLSMGRQDPDEASVWALISSMSKGHDQEKADEAAKEKIWQAMLLLKLAEMLAQEEEEIASGLSAISNSEKDILSALKGQDDDEERLDFTPTAFPTSNRPAFDFERLTRAWGQVFTQDNRAGEASFLTSSRQESYLLLADIYEAKTGTTPREIIKITLPDLGDIDLEKFLEMRGQIQETAREQLDALNKLLGQQHAGKAINAETLANFKEIEAKINGAISSLTGDNPKQKTLTFYAYEMVNLKDLFLMLSRKEATEETPAESGPLFLAVLS